MSKVKCSLKIACTQSNTKRQNCLEWTNRNSFIQQLKVVSNINFYAIINSEGP
jgi:hypothetical protein